MVQTEAVESSCPSTGEEKPHWLISAWEAAGNVWQQVLLSVAVIQGHTLYITLDEVSALK